VNWIISNKYVYLNIFQVNSLLTLFSSSKDHVNCNHLENKLNAKTPPENQMCEFLE